MSDENKKSEKYPEAAFEEVWIDVNGFTAKEWHEIRLLAIRLKEQGMFKQDPLKCTIAAFVLWIENGNGQSSAIDAEPAPDGTLLN